MSYKKNKFIIISLLILSFVLVFGVASAKQKHEANFDDLSDYYSTKMACNGNDTSDCTDRAEYKFYLKMYDLYYLYKNKYKVTLDLPLIMSTLFYNSEQMSDVMDMNVSEYDHEKLVETDWNPKNVTTLDWEYKYESLPNYLVYNDSSYDMQILAKNMVTKTTEQYCVDNDGKRSKSEKVKDTEDDLKCDDGETLKKGSSTYKLDYDKYDDFLLKYIEYKYYLRRMVDDSCIPGKSNSIAKPSGVSSNDVDGNIIIGDSRTVGMCMTVYNKTQDECTFSTGGGIQIDNDYIIAQGSMGSSWLKSTAIPAVNEYLKKNSGKVYNIITYMGVNGLDIDNYISIYNEVISSDWASHNVILMSVNPVDEVTERGYGYTVKNSDIENFNKKLSSEVTGDNVLYCDTYSQIEHDFNSFDGIHYEGATYRNIHNLTDTCISDGGFTTKSNLSCSSSKIGGFKDGDIIYYNQCDYSQYPYGSFGNICGYGCGPTSLAIVISSMTGEEHDPVEITNHVCSIGGCTGVGTSLAAIGQTIEDYGFHYKQTMDITEVYDALSSGDALVIASMGPFTFTDGGHYITLTAATGNNTVMVHDPGDRFKNHEWDLNLIGTETNFGFWIVTR